MKKAFIITFLTLASMFASQCAIGQPAFNTDVAVTTVDTVLPPVPIGLDLHAYFSSFLVYVATIIMITQALKKLFKWEDKKALILAFAVGAVVTFIGYYFKLGLLAIYEWWGSVIWYVGYMAGSLVGYEKINLILKHLGFTKK
jgi:hypothetical protein